MSALRNEIEMSLSCGSNERPAHLVRLRIVIQSLKALQSGARNNRATLDRPFSGQQLKGIVGIANDVVAVMPSDPDLYGSEAHAVRGSHYAILHANHPTQRITLGLVPVEVAS